MKRRIPRPLAILFGLIVLALLAMQGGRPAQRAAALQAPPVQAQTPPNPCATPSPLPGPCHPNNPHTKPVHANNHARGQQNGPANARGQTAHTATAPRVVAPRVVPATASAHTYYANKLTDACDGAGCIGSVTDCATSNNTDCTLRDAVALADAFATDVTDTINLKVGTYKLTIAPSGTYLDTTTGALKLTNSMTITGAGAGSTLIDGNCLITCTDRVFEVVNQDPNTNDAVTLTALTVQNGAPLTGSDFSGCVNNGEADAAGGGGILIDSFALAGNPSTSTTTGPVALTNMTLSGNASTAHLFSSGLNSCNGGNGGGVSLWGNSNLTLSNVTMTNNKASDNGGGLSAGGRNKNSSSNGPITQPTGVLSVSGGSASGNQSCTTPTSTCQSGGGGGIFNGGSNTANAISNMTLTNNSAYGGGGIANLGILSLNTVTVGGASGSGNTALNDPGGIGNDGSLAMTNVTVSGNASSPGSESEAGGGIHNENLIGGFSAGVFSTSVPSTNVTISNNSTSGGGGGLAMESGTANFSGLTITGNTAHGGGITSDSTATLTNVTVANNVAGGCIQCTGKSFRGGAGGGIGNSSTMTLANVTVSGNTSAVPAAGIMNDSTLNIAGSLVANHGGDDCGLIAAMTSKGYNVADDGSCALGGTGDLNSTNPLLQPLASYGGPQVGAGAGIPLLTMALQASSPAINHIPSPNPCPAVAPYPPSDERGTVRPQGPACDSGAFEFNPNTDGGTGGGTGGGGTGAGGGGTGGGGGGGGGVVVPTASPPPSATPTPTRTPAPTSTPTPTPTPGCATVTYLPGWNLAGGPSGTVLTGAAGSLFTLQASDSAYESLPVTTPLVAPEGYWAFYFSSTTVTLPCVSKQTQLIVLPANHFIMVGNPGDTAATVSGADVVDAFNAATNSYSTTTGTATLQPGQGAWVFSRAGGTLTIANQ